MDHTSTMITVLLLPSSPAYLWKGEGRTMIWTVHRMGLGSDWDRAHGLRRDVGAPMDPSLMAQVPGQP
jgi:hypothetical protein